MPPAIPLLRKILPAFVLLAISFPVLGQIPGPGADRERRMMQERMQRPVIDRDSVTIRDTSVIFDPETYEQTVVITINRWSLREYCVNKLRMNNPEILLDFQPHKIINPDTYDDLTIRLRPEGRIDTIPK